MISSGQWTYVLIKMLINSNSHKENQIIQKLTTLILCNLSFLLFQTIQYAQFFCLKSQKAPINSYFQVLCAVIARYTTAVSVINEQRVACDSFALERCCLQLTSSPRDAHPARRAFWFIGRNFLWIKKSVHKEIHPRWCTPSWTLCSLYFRW